MLEITALTNDPAQEHEVYLPDGEPLHLKLRFQEQQNAWIIEELQYKDIYLYGIRIVDSLNLLYQFSYSLPFGLSCASSNGIGPSFIDDFADRISIMYILTEEECAEIKQFYTGE